MPKRTYRWLREGRITEGGLKIPAFLVFLFVALGLLGSSLLVWQTISTERSQREQAERTTRVIAAIDDINRAVLNAETGQRGYFITRDRRYLDSYRFGRELYPIALKRLQILLPEDSSSPRSLLWQIEKHGGAKFDEMAVTVEMLDRGQTREARAVVLGSDGRMAMARLRDALSELETIEKNQLDQVTAEAAAAEHRVLPLLALTIGMMIAALALGFWQALRAAHAEAQAEQAHELAEARDRADLLARELNHRVKNLFAVVLAIVRMSARDTPEAKPVVEGIAARIHALLHAHEATQGTGEAAGEAEMTRLVETVLAPHKSDGNAVEVAGPKAMLTTREATPVGLVLHELATNAVKYGAWSDGGGKIDIGWWFDGKGQERQLAISWREYCNGPCAPGEREGFGSMLIQSSARQLSGSVERVFRNDGVSVEMRFPHPVS